MKICFASIDIEHDVHTGDDKTFQGIDGMDKIFDIFAKLDIPATIFITGDVLDKYPDKVRQLAKNYEIASHSYAHRYFNELSYSEKEVDIKKFMDIYEKVLGSRPLGFRAPSHVIDRYTFGLLGKYGFKYDSSLVPHYPPFKKYRGYSGRAPLTPYNVTRNGGVTLVEIPVTGQSFGIPMAGAWIRKLPVWFYKILFIFNKPKFITLSMHSWDALDERFLPKLTKILEILRNNGYVFKSGEQIATELSSGAMERVAG